jgi:hypothetical protein
MTGREVGICRMPVPPLSADEVKQVEEAVAALADYPGAKRIVEVETQHIYLNCPRYVPHMKLVEESPYIPEKGEEQPVPPWKMKPGIKEALEGSSSDQSASLSGAMNPSRNF